MAQENDLFLFFMFFYQPWVLFLFGACFGSFLNVVLYRYPLGLSIVTPPSSCPKCNKLIAFYDNIPVFSWFILAGRCRNCKQSYSIRYALNEAVFGLVAAVSVVLYPERPLTGLSLAALCTALIPGIRLLQKCGKMPWYLAATSVVASCLFAAQLLGWF